MPRAIWGAMRNNPHLSLYIRFTQYRSIWDLHIKSPQSYNPNTLPYLLVRVGYPPGDNVVKEFIPNVAIFQWHAINY